VFLGEDLGGREGPVEGRFGDRPAVPPEPDAGGDRPGELDHAAGADSLDDLVEPRDELLRREGRPRRRRGGKRPHELCRPPRRLLIAERCHRIRDQPLDIVRRERPVPRPGGHLPCEPGGLPAKAAELGSPLVMQRAAIDRPGLAGPAVHDGLPLEPPALTSRRVTLEAHPEPLQLLVEPVGDVVGPGRELGQHRVRDAGDLGDPVLGLAPDDPEAARQLGPQTGVVHGRERPLVDLDRAGVQRQPPAVVRADPVGDHHVRVELRVERPGGVLAERRGHDPLGVHHRDLAVDAVAGVSVPLDPADHRSHGRVVGRQHLASGVVIAHGEQQRHRLRGRRRDVEPANRAFAVDPAELHVPARGDTSHHVQEVAVTDRPR
jgi:hypothetical protein